MTMVNDDEPYLFTKEEEFSTDNLKLKGFYMNLQNNKLKISHIDHLKT